MIEESRLKQLQEIDFDWKGKSVLYIGANELRFHFKDFLQENKCMVDVLEINPKACEYLRSLDWLNNVIEGNILDVLPSKKNDVVFWSHGPETVDRNYFESLMVELDKITKEVLIMMCPWGESPYEENITSLDENDFLGFRTLVLGEKNKRNNNLLAWKFKENWGGR